MSFQYHPDLFIDNIIVVLLFNVANPDIFIDDITAVLLFNVVKPDTFIDDNNNNYSIYI